MIIRLPENFIYTTPGKQDCAYVKNNILYIEGFVNFENLMYNFCQHIPYMDMVYATIVVKNYLQKIEP